MKGKVVSNRRLIMTFVIFVIISLSLGALLDVKGDETLLKKKKSLLDNQQTSQTSTDTLVVADASGKETPVLAGISFPRFHD